MCTASGYADRLALAESTKLTALRLEKAEEFISDHQVLVNSIGGVEAARSSRDPELQAIGNEYARQQGFVSNLNQTSGTRGRTRFRGTKEEKKAKAAAYRDRKQQRAVAQLEAAAAAQTELQLPPALQHEEQPVPAQTTSAAATHPTVTKPGAPTPAASKPAASEPRQPPPASAIAKAQSLGINPYMSPDKAPGLEHLQRPQKPLYKSGPQHAGAQRLVGNAFKRSV